MENSFKEIEGPKLSSDLWVKALFEVGKGQRSMQRSNGAQLAHIGLDGAAQVLFNDLNGPQYENTFNPLDEEPKIFKFQVVLPELEIPAHEEIENYEGVALEVGNEDMQH
ncbi:hypothetical protein HAX54_004305 [Datura stramonium]|uniref:Uncharacterized protein n=1 Tax=Datura stramonium TaxID=4076 RepID=A0ABS8T7H4_DATST|nr:hypothetical protein [Datura stramonium]